MRPNASSFVLSMAPTRTGTMVISFLIGNDGTCCFVGREALEAERIDAPFKYLADVGEVHLNAVLVLVCAYVHL